MIGIKDQETIWDGLYENGLLWKKNTKIKKVMSKKSVLELGVGNGKTLKSILHQNPKKVVAIDISEEAINMAQKSINSDNVIFLKSDFLKFKTNEKFDVIVCYYFLNNFKKEQRRVVVQKIKSFLKKRGTILFEDFAVGDYRQKGKTIEENTIKKQNGLICHFFEKKEIFDLFKNFKKIEFEEKTFSPIRIDKSVKRNILKATIRAR